MGDRAAIGRVAAGLSVEQGQAAARQSFINVHT